jgi:hemolysin III
MVNLKPGIISEHVSNDVALAFIWVVALMGSAAKVIFARKFETAGLALYVALGCTVVSFTHAVKEGFAGGNDLLWELKKSGFCYLFGLIFYLDDEIPFSNSLWHSCVLSGAVSHWFIIYRLLACGDERYPLPPL